MTVAETHDDRLDPRNIARMMQIAADGGGPLWEHAELAAILQHQLTCPVRFDLESLGTEIAAQAAELAESRGLVLKSIGDLLAHPAPTLELLRLLKAYARTCRSHPDSLLPPEVATALYYAAIVAARLRCGERISDLDDGTIRHGLEWLLEQPWLEESLRSLLREGLPCFGAG